MYGNYQCCYPDFVRGWTPLNSFKTFIVKENAGEHFVKVNNRVKKVCEDIDDVKSALTTLKNKMGDNTGTTTQINNVVKALEQKKSDVIKKNQELIAACEQVVQYIYENKANKAEEASAVARTIENISIYQG